MPFEMSDRCQRPQPHLITERPEIRRTEEVYTKVRTMWGQRYTNTQPSHLYVCDFSSNFSCVEMFGFAFHSKSSSSEPGVTNALVAEWINQAEFNAKPS